MFKAVGLLVSAALTASVVMIPSAALADPSNPPGQNGSNAQLLQSCYDKLASGDFSDSLTLGRCMAFNSVSDQGWATQVCQFFRGEDLLEDFGFESFSDCVTNLH
jgi:hypothetical protein